MQATDQLSRRSARAGDGALPGRVANLKCRCPRANANCTLLLPQSVASRADYDPGTLNISRKNGIVILRCAASAA